MSISLIKEEQEMVPGGDLRCKGNKWLRSAWESVESKIPRVPREAEVRRIIQHLIQLHPICILDHVLCMRAWHMIHASYDNLDVRAS